MRLLICAAACDNTSSKSSDALIVSPISAIFDRTSAGSSEAAIGFVGSISLISDDTFAHRDSAVCAAARDECTIITGGSLHVCLEFTEVRKTQRHCRKFKLNGPSPFLLSLSRCSPVPRTLG